MADFDGLKLRCPYVAFMPQWDFLNFLAARAARYPTFSLKMEAEVRDIIETDGRVTGVRATTPRGPLEVRADLVIAADGRTSVIRDKAKLPVDDFGAPMDVLWFGITRKDSDPDETMGRFDEGHMLVEIDRRDYWQCGYVIPKGSVEALKARGLPAFRDNLARLVPFLADRVGELDSWDKIKLLSVQVNRLRQWHRPGLLCIGDAAHAMSPVGGVGINLAVQDAVATANLLAAPLRARTVAVRDLAAVQQRRTFPARVTQSLQLSIQNRVLKPVLSNSGPLKPPFFFHLLKWFPALRGLTARLIGVGVRPEHISALPYWPEKG
jgi:2-polyprenyl-6-methoxyphenol hydroxylase-like FAD-dependent oxidoreductase